MAGNNKYAVLNTQKFHSFQAMEAEGKHLNRTENVPEGQRSWNEELSEKNEYLIERGEKSYSQIFKEKVEDKRIKTKANSVLGFEVVLTCQRTDLTPEELKRWKKKSKEWLQKYFGNDNVIEAVYHGDESKNENHIHAVVIPVVGDRLSTATFLDGPEKLSAMYDSYYEEVKEFGLVRGQKKHPEVPGWGTMNHLKEAAGQVERRSLTPPEKGDSVEELYVKLQKEFSDANMKHYVETNMMINEHKRELSAALFERDTAIQEKNDAIDEKDRLAKENAILTREKDRAEDKAKEWKDRYDALFRRKTDGFDDGDYQNLESLRMVFWAANHGYKEDVLGSMDGAIDFYKQSHRMRNEKSR